MSSIPVTSVEDSDSLCIYSREGLEVADEAMFIVDLLVYHIS